MINVSDNIKEALKKPTTQRKGKIVLNRKTTKRSNDFEINDAVDKQVDSFKIYGKTEQETRSGKNLFNINSNFRNSGSDYIDTITNNGFYFEKPTYRRLDIYTDKQKTLEVGTYTISFDVLENTTTVNTGLAIRTNATQEVYIYIQPGFVGKYTSTINLTTGTTNAIYMYLSLNDIDGAKLNIQNIQLEKGSKATEYEQYGVSPSPEYPSEIKNVKGVTNLFNINDAEIGNSWNNSKNTKRATVVIPFEGNKEYSIKCFEFGELSSIGIVETANRTSSLYNKTYTSNFGTTIISNPATKYICIQMQSSEDITKEMIENIKIVVNENILSYSYVPYGTWLEVKNTGKNIFKNTGITRTMSGITFTKNNDGTVLVNGTFSSKTYYPCNDEDLPIKPNTKYFLNGAESASCRLRLREFDKNRTQLSEYFDTGNGVSFTTKPNVSYVIVQIVVNANKNNVLIKPMISKDGGEYEPYKETTTLIDMNKPNLFDKNNANTLNITIGTTFVNSANAKLLYVPIIGGKTYTISKIKSSRFRICTSIDTPENGKSCYQAYSTDNTTFTTIKTNDDSNYLCVYYYLKNTDTLTEQEILDSIKIFEGTSPKPYYELSKIDKEDELIIKDGKTYIVKKNNEIVLNGNENWRLSASGSDNWSYRLITTYTTQNNQILCNYYPKATNISSTNTTQGIQLSTTGELRIRYGNEDTITNFKTWLSNNPVTVQYELIEPEIIELPSYDIELFEGYNKITTNDSLEPSLELQYYKGEEQFIYNATLLKDCYDEGNYIANAIASQLEFDMDDIDKFNKFKYYEGIYTGNDYEYIDLGTFHVFDENKQNDFKKHIVAYDNLIKFNETFIDRLVYPTTIYELLQDVCEQASVELINETIPNGNYIVENNQFRNNESLKTVLKAICGISGNYAIIKNDKVILQLKNETTEQINSSQHELIDWKRPTYGINQLILGMQNVEGEYVLVQDDDDIEQNGVHKLVINDNPFAYTQDKRQELINEIWEHVKGFGYIPYELKCEWLPWLEVGDTIKIDGIDTIVLRVNSSSPKSLETTMSAPAVIDSAIDYLDNTNDINNKLMNTQIIVDKHEGTITSLSQTTETLREDLSNNYYTIQKTNELVQNSSQGITNTFSEAGGNNIFRNTGLWFKETNEDFYEYWTGEVEKKASDKAANQTSMLLKNGYLEQQQQVSNGNYTVSFKYNKLVKLSTCKVIINDFEYELTGEGEQEFVTGKVDDNGEYITQPLIVTAGNIKIKLYTDVDDAIEIYDLMVNAGTVKLAYSQNQNETTTDTVNISKGITITSSNSDTIFKANSDGIRTLNKSNEVLSEFTDKGMKNKQMEVTDEATIVNVLIQNVGDQTWFTRI